MTRDQHLEFCKRCKNREFNPQQGIVCSLTKKIAAFEGTCENFNLDETVKMEEPPASEPTPAYAVVADMSTDVKNKLRVQQDLVYAIVGGFSASLVGALLWAIVTVATKYQIGYMAIGVGLLVGFAVRYFGSGIDQIFGIVGAFFALVGCALGNLFSQVGFIADAESLGYFDTLTLLNLASIISIYKEAFAPMDIVFYAIAAYEGYKFAFRTIPDELIKAASVGKLDPPPYAQFRLPIVIALFVALFTCFFFFQKAATGTKVFYYQSGAKQSEGILEYGVESGLWKSWWESGKPQFVGFYKNGKQDSSWQFFNESGELYRTGSFKSGIQDGLWSDLFPNGKVSSKGFYKMGRQEGGWTYYYDDGVISQKAHYHLDMPDSIWEFFFPSGKPRSRGKFIKGESIGPWVYFNESGSKNLELDFVNPSYAKINNAWDKNGDQIVADGTGTYVEYYDNGVVSEKGTVRQADRTGIWKRYFPTGKLKEEGEYKNSTYFLINTFDLDSKEMVRNGEGTFENYYDEKGTVQESGQISKGMRVGEWKQYFPSGNVSGSLIYQNGVLTGGSKVYFESGELNVEGTLSNNLRDGEWKWYYQDGKIETSVTYVNGLKEGGQPFYNESGILLYTEQYTKSELTNVTISVSK